MKTERFRWVSTMRTMKTKRARPVRNVVLRTIEFHPRLERLFTFGTSSYVQNIKDTRSRNQKKRWQGRLPTLSLVEMEFERPLLSTLGRRRIVKSAASITDLLELTNSGAGKSLVAGFRYGSCIREWFCAYLSSRLSKSWRTNSARKPASLRLANS